MRCTRCWPPRSPTGLFSTSAWFAASATTPGAVFQVYDPAHGVPIGSGGRYDELLGRFGRPLTAVGFALNVERLHIALTGEERGRS